MGQQVQLRRGTTSEHSTFTGAVGEVTVDTDKDVVVVHDGSTAGGFPLVKEAAIGVTVQSYDADTAKLDEAQTFTAAQTFAADVTLNAQSDLRFADSDSTNWVALQAPATIASNVTWTLPSTDGSSGQYLETDGSGNLSWVNLSAGSGLSLTSNTISFATTSNGYGTRTVSTSDPTGGSDGDIWLKVS